MFSHVGTNFLKKLHCQPSSEESFRYIEEAAGWHKPEDRGRKRGPDGRRQKEGEDMITVLVGEPRGSRVESYQVGAQESRPSRK